MLEYLALAYVGVHVLAHERTERHLLELFAPVLSGSFFRPFRFEGFNVLNCINLKHLEPGRLKAIAGFCSYLILITCSLLGDNSLIEYLKPNGKAFFVEVVVGIYETLRAGVICIKASPNVFRYIIQELSHDSVVIEVFFAVHIVATYIVRAFSLLTYTAAILTKAKRHKLCAIVSGKVALGPASLLVLISVIVFKAIVILKLALQA